MFPLILGVSSNNSAVGLHTISTEGNTLVETLDHNFHTFLLTGFSNKCFGEEVNDGDGVGQLHGVSPCRCTYYRASRALSKECCATSMTVTPSESDPFCRVGFLLLFWQQILPLFSSFVPQYR